MDKALAEMADSLEVCRRFMQISGIGPIGSLSFYSAVEEPTRFKRNEDIGPFLGMVPRVKQSGPIVRRFGISRMGNKMTRQHLMTAASIHLRRAPENAAVRIWGEQLKERLPSQKVRIAVARKLAIIMLAMWKNNTDYNADGRLFRSE
jgi:transposase